MSTPALSAQQIDALFGLSGSYATITAALQAAGMNQPSIWSTIERRYPFVAAHIRSLLRDRRAALMRFAGLARQQPGPFSTTADLAAAIGCDLTTLLQAARLSAPLRAHMRGVVTQCGGTPVTADQLAADERRSAVRRTAHAISALRSPYVRRKYARWWRGIVK
jgi:hypothetical protein